MAKKRYKQIFPHKKRERRSLDFLFLVYFFHSPLLSFFLSLSVSSLSTFLFISLLLSLSPSLCFIQQKQRSHITGRPEGFEKEDGREEKRKEEFKTKCRRKLERVCDVAE